MKHTVNLDDSFKEMARVLNKQRAAMGLPNIGDGVTESIGSDRYAFTVIEVKSDRKLVIQADFADRTDDNGQSESQEYEFKRNPDGRKKTITLRKDGKWRLMNDQSCTYRYKIGTRSAYKDPSF